MDSGSAYLFLGVEKARRYRGTYPLGRLALGDTAMQVGQLFLADIGRDINPVIKVADRSLLGVTQSVLKHQG